MAKPTDERLAQIAKSVADTVRSYPLTWKERAIQQLRDFLGELGK
jgi:hypothetical protein